jgi:hypothetical protein
LSYFPRVQKEDDPKAQPTINHPHSQRSEPYISLASIVAIILLKSTFIPNFNPRPEYQSNYHRYPSQYYQPYNYTMHTSQVHRTQPTITYPPAPLQITYPTASSQIAQPKTEPNNLPPPIQQSQDSSQQSTCVPTFGTIHTITGGGNVTFENKRQK